MRVRDEFVTAWLLRLLDRGATYGYELRRELDARGLSIDSAVVYRTLRRLERDTLVASCWVKSGIGPRRRSYELTAEGRRRLDETAGHIRTTRAIHDLFLRAHEEYERASDTRAAP